jgi:hypothetical protein
VEAPHLAKLYKKYKDQGFRILAVNGWDEPLVRVKDFAEKNDLTYAIALNGRKVARTLYGVHAYPTSFWVDSEGRLVDQEIGFGGAEALEARLKKMLSEAKEKEEE